MTDEQDKTPAKPDDIVIRRLAQEASITEAQARELVAFLGLNW